MARTGSGKIRRGRGEGVRSLRGGVRSEERGDEERGVEGIVMN